jgi:hypothetical protein
MHPLCLWVISLQSTRDFANQKRRINCKSFQAFPLELCMNLNFTLMFHYYSNSGTSPTYGSHVEKRMLTYILENLERHIVLPITVVGARSTEKRSNQSIMTTPRFDNTVCELAYSMGHNYGPTSPMIPQQSGRLGHRHKTPASLALVLQSIHHGLQHLVPPSLYNRP